MIKFITLSLIGLLATAQFAFADSPNRFKMENDACLLGMVAFADLTQIGIQTSSLSRKTIGNCTAKSVRVSMRHPYVEFLADRMEWNRQGLVPLIDGVLPQNLLLEFHNVRVIAAPKNNPAWFYLSRSGVGGRKFDARLAFSFTPKDGKLELLDATVDFGAGNRIIMRAHLRGVNPTLPQSPQLSSLAIVAEKSSFIIQSGAGRENPVIGMGMALLKDEIGPESMDHFKTRAITYIDDSLRDSLADSSRQALKRLVLDMPHPRGDIVLKLDATGGFALIGLGLLRKGADPVQVLGGLGASFSYGLGIAQ